MKRLIEIVRFWLIFKMERGYPPSIFVRRGKYKGARFRYQHVKIYPEDGILRLSFSLSGSFPQDPQFKEFAGEFLAHLLCYPKNYSIIEAMDENRKDDFDEFVEE